jgi:hypothetical protein
MPTPAELLTTACIQDLPETVLRFVDAPQPAKDRRLAPAASDGNVELLSALLHIGADLHFRNDIAIRHACLAPEDRRRVTVDYLLNHGADVNAKDTETLWIAAEQGDLALVNLLLKRGADPRSDRPAIVAAATRGHLAVAQALVAAGADRSKGVDAIVGETVRGAMSMRQGFQVPDLQLAVYYFLTEREHPTVWDHLLDEYNDYD